MQKVLVVGMGYVGLTQLIGCASRDFWNNYEFYGTDKDLDKINSLKQGIIPIFEEGLTELYQKVVDNDPNKIQFLTPDEWHEKTFDIIFCCVGTPMKEDGSADLSQVFGVGEEVWKHNTNGECILVNKSTVPVGTCWELSGFSGVSVVSNPEFLREGTALKDFSNPDRIVIGGWKAENIKKFYVSLGFDNSIIVTMGHLAEAELSKYVSNVILASRVALINELANFCDKCDINMDKILEATCMDSRIGTKFFNPGPGFGGSCFPKDIQSLYNQSNKSLSIVGAVIDSNNKQLNRVSDALLKCIKTENVKNICIVGAGFKTGTDDMRQSPCIQLLNNIENWPVNLNITIYDPIIGIEEFESQVNTNLNITITDNLEDLRDHDLIVILNEPQDLNQLLDVLNDIKIILDGRMIVPLDWINPHINKMYWGIGRGGYSFSV